MGAHIAVAGIVAGLVSVVVSAFHHRRTTWSVGLTLVGLALIALARWLRGDAAVPPEPILVGVAVLGAVLITVGTWLGQLASGRRQPESKL